MDNNIVERYLDLYDNNSSYAFKYNAIEILVSVNESDAYGSFISWDENTMCRVIFENYEVRKFSTFFRMIQEICYFRDYYIAETNDQSLAAAVPEIDMKSKHILDIYSDMVLEYYDLYFESPEKLYEYLLTGFEIENDAEHISFNEILITYLMLLFSGFSRTNILYIKRSDITRIRGTSSYVVIVNGVAETIEGITAELLSNVLTTNNMCVYRPDRSIPQTYERDEEYIFLLKKDGRNFVKRRDALSVKYTNSCHKYFDDSRCPRMLDINVAGIALKIQEMLSENDMVDTKHNVLSCYNRLNGKPDNYVNNFDTANTIVGIYEIYKKNKK